MNISADNPERLDHLDVVRSFALMLGVIFHASLSFMPIFIGWAVMDVSSREIISIFVLISHSFRMELFFLLAGFFAHMKFHQLGIQGFLASRMVRIALPFVLGWFVLRPLIVSGWVMGSESMRGDVNIGTGLIVGLESLLALPNDLFVGTHLWFLYYLLIISFCCVLLVSVIKAYMPLYNALRALADKGCCWLSRSTYGMYMLAIPTCACLWFMGGWSVDTPDKSLVPNVAVFVLYSGFFIFGWLLHRRTERLKDFSCLRWHKVVLCIVAIMACVMLSSFESQFAHPNYLYIKLTYLFCYALMMWTLVMIAIGLCQRFFNRPNRIVRYIADASYWLYLIHLPVVIWLQIAFAELPLHWLVKLTAISLLTISLSLIIYDLLVRGTWLGAVLNGKRKTRFFS